jgi:betaine-aldehyde dehydrogenase
MVSLTERTAHYINGSWIPPVEGGVIEVVNPATEEVFGRAPDGSVADMLAMPSTTVPGRA